LTGSGQGYRPALDGVRALAVLAVFGYHLGFPGLRGGFLGVDAFFVLSGYLITGILLDEYASKGGIDLARFWLRRARRLLPALFVMVGVVAIWISTSTPAFELGLRRSDLLWTIFYGANWHFIATGQDYFAQFASASPVRHTWSLAIEEQFYLAWPLVALAALRLGRAGSRSIAAVAAVGIVVSALATAVLYDPGDPSRAYYGTDARIHELLVGALLAAVIRGSGRLPRRFAPQVAGGAISIVVAAMVLLPDDHPAYYLGGSLAFAVAVAALLWAIDTAPTSRVARALSFAPAVSIGRVSYGIYLWHWPVILAFPSAPVVSALVTIAAATASFVFLEQPIRTGRFPGIRRSGHRFAMLAASAAAVLVATTVWATSTPPGVSAVVAEIDGCDRYAICVRHQEAANAPVLAVVGDSVARSLDPAFQELASRHRWTYVIAAPNGCRLDALLLSNAGVTRQRDRDCVKEVPRLRRELISTWQPTLVIAMDRWEIVAAVAPDGHIAQSGAPEHVALTEAALKDVTLEFTNAGAHVVLIELPPLLPAECGTPGMVDKPTCRARVDQDSVHAPYNAAFRRIANTVPGVATISLVDGICPGGVCVPEIKGTIVRPDGLHFAVSAGPWLGDLIDRELTRAELAFHPPIASVGADEPPASASPSGLEIQP
jgi:peptidoglycan/LPS O-acetylase OafA/YrhL